MAEPILITDPAPHAPKIEKGFLLNVGSEVYPVYGSEQRGWTLDSGDLDAHVAAPFRYQSLAELFFVIVNFNLTENGRA